MSAARRSWQVRRAAERGHLALHWLDARFSFSFGEWRDADWPRFGPLIALNEDQVQPRTGFNMHPHRDLEILMLPLEGAVEHRDDRGGRAIVRPGELQFMHAGRGIRHSQHNPLHDTVDRHLQVWIAPRESGLAPEVAHVRLPARSRGWTRLAAVSAAPVIVAADVEVALGDADIGDELLRSASPGRAHYLHVIDGTWRAELGPASETISLLPGDALVLLDDALDARLLVEGNAPGRLIAFDAALADVLATRPASAAKSGQQGG
ncbi:pirin family protein [Piscinibacter sp. HJYY11]|uniref:pirin family protein n=1 Tax=Piscinibacter sp. HJYY11 TaxID=2801333 RepID=UPI00191DE035|nr:pirin family protein [Piscinibacter sp. HJYY11]MBL0729417.1 pirin family protein [Piscinibacter sp. HJYY11]